MNRTTRLLTAAAMVMPAAIARGQTTYDLSWHTIDCGGGATGGGGWDLVASIAQPDAGYMSSGRSDGFTLTGGFWSDGIVPCYANCDGLPTMPVLNVNDFTCFLNRFAAGDGYANCDGSTAPPVLNVNDFTCFLNKYAMGCP